MWESEDIWVRNDATAGGHQDPILGQVNYVHVLWENKGSATAYNAVKGWLVARRGATSRARCEQHERQGNQRGHAAAYSRHRSYRISSERPGESANILWGAAGF